MKFMSRLILVFFFLAGCGFLKAQADNGTLRGRIYRLDNNENVPYASVSVYGTATGVLSDADGNFRISGLKPGYIQIKVTSVGFKPYLSEDIQVTNARPSDIEIGLDAASVQLNEVVIKGQALMRNQESPLSLRTIGIAEIEKSPGSNRDISKVLQTLPGVASTPAFRNDVIVRGGGSSENRFYLDGIEIPNINHFSTQGASGGPIGIINVDFVREVNFYSSAFPANRGNALSSVIEFKQSDGNKDKIKFKGSVGATDVGLSFDGPIAHNTTFVFSARRSYLQFLFAALKLPFLPTYNDIQTKVKIRLNDKNIISLVGLGALDAFKLNLKADKTEEQRYILGYLPVFEQSSYTVGMVYKHFGTRSNQTFVFSRNYLDNISYKYLHNIEVDSLKILDYKSSETENKFRFENNVNFANGLKINFGFSIEEGLYHNATSTTAFSFGRLLRVQYLSNLNILKGGLFVQGSTAIIKNRLNIAAGIRSDACNYSDQMAHFADQLSPHLSLSLALVKNLFINANVGEYHQLPAYTTLGYRDTMGVLVNKRNGLTYLDVDHYVTGIEYLPHENARLTCEVFLKKYHHYPFSVNDSVALSSKGADYGTFGDEEVRSIAIGRAYGAELFYQNSGFKNINLLFSYTYVRSEFQDYHGNYIPTAWDNQHILNITATRSFHRNWKAGIKWRYVGGAPYTPYDLNLSSEKSAWDARGRGYPDFTRYNQYRLKAFHQLDIRVDKEYFFNKWSLNLYLDIQNAYGFKAKDQDRLVLDEQSPDKDAGHYNLKTVPSTSGTVVPSVGVIVEF